MTQPASDRPGYEWRQVPIETETGNAKVNSMIRAQASRRTKRLGPVARETHEAAMGRGAAPAEQVPDWGPESTWTPEQRHDAAKARTAFSRQLRADYRAERDAEQDDEQGDAG